jgi:hypothetical protein
MKAAIRTFKERLIELKIPPILMRLIQDEDHRV